MPKELYTSLIDGPIGPVSSSGGDVERRVYVRSQVHAGVVPAIGRESVLVLEEAEALALALSLFGSLSASFLESADGRKTLATLKATSRLMAFSTLAEKIEESAQPG